MKTVFVYLFAILIGFVCADNGYTAEIIESEDKMDKEDQEAFESFGSAVYGKSGGLPLNGKSGYPVLPNPAIPASAVPAGYAGYLASLGYGNFGYGYAPNAYGRYGVLPYSSALLGYGSPYNSLPYGYGPALSASLLGSGFAYGSPAYGRGTYTIYGNGYTAPLGLGYRYGGLGYNSALVRAPALPVNTVPVNAVPAPAVPAPAAYAGVPAAYANAPLPVPAAIAARPLPIPAAPYRPAVVATQGKDGTLRYTYAGPVAQQVPPYKK